MTFSILRSLPLASLPLGLLLLSGCASSTLAPIVPPAPVVPAAPLPAPATAMAVGEEAAPRAARSWELAAAGVADPGVPEKVLTDERIAAAAAQDERATGTKEGDRTAFVGIGFTNDPDTFLLGGELDIHVDDRLSWGPMLQWGIDDEVTIFAPSLQGKIRFPLERSGSGPRIVPFAQAGLGWCWIDVDGPGGADADDSGFLLHLGGGVELDFDEMLFASTVTIDILPDEVLDEELIFAWQIVQIGFRF